MTKRPRRKPVSDQQDNPNIANEEQIARSRMLPAPTTRDAADPPELQQAEYPPDILPIYVAKMYNTSHTPGDVNDYPTPPPPPSDVASGDLPIEPTPAGPPVNVNVPHVSQAADILNCTMGNWDNTPTRYDYQWQVDGADVGANENTYAVQADDVGKEGNCTVTATNAVGSTVAPSDNHITIE
jgi:hypothetical protein